MVLHELLVGVADVRRHSVCALKGPRVSHSGVIALSVSRRLRSTLVAAPVLFAYAVVTVAKTHTSATPNLLQLALSYVHSVCTRI